MNNKRGSFNEARVKHALLACAEQALNHSLKRLTLVLGALLELYSEPAAAFNHPHVHQLAA